MLGPRQTLDELGLSAQDLHDVVLDQITGDPAEATIRFAQNCPAPIIVMATQTGGPRPRATLGPIAEAVLSSAFPRVLLVTPDRGDRPWEIRRIVMAHDGTPTSGLGTAIAADLSSRWGGVALHVAARHPSHPALEPGSLPAPRYVDQKQHEWPAWASEFMERMLTLGAAPTALNFRLLVTGGQPGSEIAQYARDHGADLVVLAWNGRWRPQHAGALKVAVRRSGCPVLLISAPPLPTPV